MCSGLGSGDTITFALNDGLLSTDLVTTTTDIQLTSGAPSPAHNILQCSVYAYALSSKSVVTTIPISSPPAE